MAKKTVVAIKNYIDISSLKKGYKAQEILKRPSSS